MNNYNQNKNQQRLYWAFSKALRWLGLTLDEWVIALLGICPGLFFLNDDHMFLGFFCLLSGIILCCLCKKFKKLSEYFLLKSFLLAHGLLWAPSKQYPNMLNKRVGR